MSGGGRVIARIWYKHRQHDGDVLPVILITPGPSDGDGDGSAG
jgi:hypothetical protein